MLIDLTSNEVGKCGEGGRENSKGNSWAPSGSLSWALELRPPSRNLRRISK